jgi:hypothetical protein
MGDEGVQKVMQWDHSDDDPLSCGLDERLHKVRPGVEKGFFHEKAVCQDRRGGRLAPNP